MDLLVRLAVLPGRGEMLAPAAGFWVVVAGAKADRPDWAITDERPKPVRIRASKNFFNDGREFIVYSFFHWDRT